MVQRRTTRRSACRLLAMGGVRAWRTSELRVCVLLRVYGRARPRLPRWCREIPKDTRLRNTAFRMFTDPHHLRVPSSGVHRVGESTYW